MEFRRRRASRITACIRRAVMGSCERDPCRAVKWGKTIRYILLLATFEALAVACSVSPPDEGQSAAPASEHLAPAEAAPTPPSGASGGDVSGVFQYPQSGGRAPSPGIASIMDPPPLNEDACEIYAPADDGGLKVLASGDPGYERRVSLLIAAFQDMARETPTPEREGRTARIAYLSDCIARARGE